MTTETLSERQLEIVEAAGRILTRSGISGLTIKNLAKEMQFSESAIYRHFTSKTEIILALLNYLADNMARRFAAQDKKKAPGEAFLSLFQVQCDFFIENPHFVVAVFSDGLMEEGEAINRAVLKIMHVKKNHLEILIQDGQKDGVFTDTIPKERITQIVMGSFRLLMFKWRAEQFSFDLRKESDALMHSLLNLLKSN